MRWASRRSRRRTRCVRAGHRVGARLSRATASLPSSSGSGRVPTHRAQRGRRGLWQRMGATIPRKIRHRTSLGGGATCRSRAPRLGATSPGTRSCAIGGAFSPIEGAARLSSKGPPSRRFPRHPLSRRPKISLREASAGCHPRSLTTVHMCSCGATGCDATWCWIRNRSSDARAGDLQCGDANIYRAGRAAIDRPLGRTQRPAV